jgi:hypothetical protein
MFSVMVVRTRLVLGKYKYVLAAMLFMFTLWIRWRLCSASWGLVGLLYFARLSTHVQGNGWNSREVLGP